MAKWMTIPQWESVAQVNVFRREQEAAAKTDRNMPQNVHVLVRKEVALPAGECRLRISADDYYYAWVDGEFLGCGPAPANHPTCYYQEYSIPGGRTVTVALHLYYQGLVNRVWCSGDGRFGVYLEIRHEEKTIACCDETWKFALCTAYSGETVGYDTQYLENFDSRLYPRGWKQSGFDDTWWGNLVLAAWADYQLCLQPIPNLQWTNRKPVRTWQAAGGTVVDFGKEITALLDCTVTGKPRQQVTLRYGDELQDGQVQPLRCNCPYEEVWTLDGGRNVLHPYDYKTFRYVQLTCQPEKISAWVRHYPMDDDLCRLHWQQDELEQIFEICKNAVRCCAQEGYLDCPSREKGQYLGDAIITARSHLWLTGDNRLLRKCITDFMSTSRSSPTLMAVAPGSLMQEIGDFSLLFPMLPLMDYDFTGDKDFLAKCYPGVVSLIDGFSRYVREDGLLENVSELWNLVDWPENFRDGYDFPLTRPVVGEGCHNVVNALWCAAWLLQERMEEILELPCSHRSDEVIKSFVRVFYKPEQGLFADSESSDHCSLHANIYPACFGFHPDPEAFEALLLQRKCGVFPMYFALLALARLGRHETLYRLLTRQDVTGWRNMLRQGATSCFEVWGKEQKWNTSLCHAWASYPISLIIEELAGLHPVAGRLEFAPRYSGFSLRVPFAGRKYHTDGITLTQC